LEFHLNLARESNSRIKWIKTY